MGRRNVFPWRTAGVIIGTHIFAKSIKIKLFFYLLLDAIACVAPIGIFLEELQILLMENFSENLQIYLGQLFFLNVDNIPRHPSQLYEAFLRVLLFLILILLFITKKK